MEHGLILLPSDTPTPTTTTTTTGGGTLPPPPPLNHPMGHAAAAAASGGGGAAGVIAPARPAPPRYVTIMSTLLPAAAACLHPYLQSVSVLPATADVIT